MNKFIHQFSSAYLAIVILIRMMAMPISILDFSLNKSYIAGHLCENRMNVALHCSGKCFLNKQLARSNDNQGSGEQKASVRIVIIDFLEPITKPSFDFVTGLHTNYPEFINKPLDSSYSANIFHPPIYMRNA